MSLCVSVCVCVRERERERDSERKRVRGRKTGAVTVFDIYLLTDENAKKRVLLFHLNASSMDDEKTQEFDT